MSELGLTEQTSRSEPELEERERTAFVVLALECDRPLAGSSRHSLRNVDRVSIGRGAERRVTRSDHGSLTIRLADRRLSGSHCELSRLGGRWVLEDRGSTNGSFVNGQRTARHTLADRDLIEVGRTLLVYREHLAPRGTPRDVGPEQTVLPGVSTLHPGLAAELERVARIATSGVPVVVLGETGTGKEVLARGIHALSQRPGPFVAVNCGAIPDGLLEAQLFGHVKGAFSGAVKSEIGFVRSAHFGTLFLDEIGDLPMTSQVALLRVLQSGEVVPVGSASPIQVDVRIVAATHRALDALMESDAFRRDLYARLAGFITLLPPLRERIEDLGQLMAALLGRQSHAAPETLSFRPEAARALFLYDWPLNVRELEQCLASAAVLAAGNRIAPEHLPQAVRQGAGTRKASERPGSVRPSAPPELGPEDAALKSELSMHLAQAGGNLSEVARRMGKARQQIQRWVRRFGLKIEDFRGSG